MKFSVNNYRRDPTVKKRKSRKDDKRISVEKDNWITVSFYLIKQKLDFLLFIFQMGRLRQHGHHVRVGYMSQIDMYF